ncbi:S8 family serine peptidase [Marinobacter pelagius]|uniref:S8 family serine peptidase n=1 Tax=Marinobacter sp. C7 TaxID=2951363 RepID=UPI001EF13470|nr:S8 family serine peptidase [Marinobacter sp. C7]MCG7198991.1 S8 family serine peptidase [Marinobacter sp. C7]
MFRIGLVVSVLAVLAGCGGGSGGGETAPVDVALSGVIDIEAGTRVDIDTADSLSLNPSPFSGVQALPREFVLAGYVSRQEGAYPTVGGLPGSEYFIDARDQFSMTLAPDQRISLQAFATRAGRSNLSIRLLAPDAGNAVISTAQTTETDSQVSVSLSDDTTQSWPEGTYQVEILASSVPMLYILSSSASNLSAQSVHEWPDHQFAEGEAIVVMEETPGMPAQVSATGMTKARALGRGLWQVRMAGPLSQDQGNRAGQTLSWIENLRKEAAIKQAVPNYLVQTQGTPLDEPLYNDPALGQQWHYELLNAPIAWQLAPGAGEGVAVAVMDTGLFGQPGNWHPDLNANVGQGFDFVSQEYDTDSQPGPDSNPSDPGNSVGGSVYHGTHVAGTVAAVDNERGGIGVAFSSTLVPVRVLGEGGTGSSADLLDALNWVNDDGTGQPRADVVNLSLGGLPYIQALQDAINAGTERGAIYVAAAGNAGTSNPSYPAAFANVLAVSAVDGAGVLSSYSNFGPWIDLAAPGGDASRDGNADGRGDLVSSTSAAVIDGTLTATYAGLQGTSMAAPHVSGVLALMKNQNLTLDYPAVNAMLQAGKLTVSSCDNPCRNDDLGWGLMDAAKSVLAASDTPVTDLLTASPAIVTLSTEGAASVTAALEVYGDSPSSVEIMSVELETSAAWVDVTAPPAGSSGTSFSVRLDLNADALEQGVSERTVLLVTYQGDVEERTLEIPIIGQQPDDLALRNAGRHFVLLVDPVPEGDIFTTVSQATVEVVNGQYQFSFRPDDGVAPRFLSEVPPGDYFLVAGSDIDNDGLICHAGEACAEYPVSGLREEITITAGEAIQGIRMTTSYSRPTISAQAPDVLPRPGFEGYRVLSAQPDNENTKSIR